ncbi:MFS transporter [Acinetobacter stercoris]|uniref:Purine efflux pump PbuE n=1 Tax=Acinetobacter stercoris TaxID=2126983 RepID=A0A2U3N310_9GAMM|nr:MFS transporter [Acinetobacter stercoris]SPL72004.1 Purine efflux pump PbuE [Acinetobacter stercoris]
MSNAEKCKSAESNLTANTDHIPLAKLLAFSIAGFLTIMTETIPAGLLPQISQGLQISEAQAGQLISAYAMGSVIAAIPVIALTRTWNRRPLFLLAIAGLLVFNSLTALSTHYMLTLAVRFIAGMCAGIIWGLLAGYARRLVPFHLQGKALAIASVGQPLALAIGVPLGTWLGSIMSWQSVFWIMSILAFILYIWFHIAVPDFTGQEQKYQKPIHLIFLISGIPSVLLTLFCWILAHNILYTYIAPFSNSMGLGNQVDLILMLFGLSSIIGIWLTGLYVDRWLRKLTLYSLALFAVAISIFAFSSQTPLLIFFGIMIWGITFGGAPTLLQTALADTAGEDADVAQSMLVTIFNLAVAGGSIFGGILLSQYGIGSFIWVMLGLIVIGFVLVWLAKMHGFRHGQRS